MHKLVVKPITSLLFHIASNIRLRLEFLGSYGILYDNTGSFPGSQMTIILFCLKDPTQDPVQDRLHAPGA